MTILDTRTTAANTLTPADRQGRIVAELHHAGTVSIVDLAHRLHCSVVTIRRDLRLLRANNSQIVTTHGSASLRTCKMRDEFEQTLRESHEEKLLIGDCVTRMLRPPVTIAMDGGTTTTMVARSILSSGELRPITVVTNAVNIAYELSGYEDVQVVVVGGTVTTQNFELAGSVTSLQNFHVGVAVVGCYGIALKSGVTAYTEVTAIASRAMIERAQRVWVVADHTKVGRAGLANIVELARVECLVTDQLPADAREELQHTGLRVIEAANAASTARSGKPRVALA